MIPNSLVLFCSWSGHTRRAARIIAEQAGADLLELRPKEPYPATYAQTVRRARREIQAKLRPALHPLAQDWSGYETLFLGTPNWCGTIAPSLASFLYQTMPADKNIVPFCTHGGGGAGSIAREIAHYCIGCDVLPLLALRDDGVADWDQAAARWLLRVERILELLRRERSAGAGYPYGP